MELDCQILQRDIRQLQPVEISVDHIDFIIGGPPCQSFSAIGRRAGGIDGIGDERGSLFEHYCRLVQYYQPQGFLFENVRGSETRPYTTGTLFHYPSLKQRNKIKIPPFPETGSIYWLCTQRAGETCFIDVYRYDPKGFINTQLLRYTLDFHHLIGDGIQRIECTLLSNSDEDIPVAWDAIEDCLSS